MTIIATSTRVRLPVGSLIAVGPPWSGKTTILRPALPAAGLPASHVVCRDEPRIKHGNRCADLAHRAVPASCLHHEQEVDGESTLHCTTFLASGQTWLYDQAGLNEDRL